MNTAKREKRKSALRIFLSHTAADSAYARRLSRSLLSQRPNLRIFNTEMLSAGEDWQSKLRDELSQCDIFIVLLSPNSVYSPWVLKELGAAWGLEKPIIPVVTDPELLSRVPVSLDKARLVDVKDVDNPEVTNQILEYYEKEVDSSRNN